MKLLTILLLAIILSIDPSKVSKINTLKAEAKKAYLAGDMKTAIEKYKMLVDSLHVNEEEVDMNLANAYFNANDTASALPRYQPLSISGNAKIKSLANQQMGVVANRQGKFEEALNYFKQALKAEPDNEQARYNYEMVKKKLEEKKKQDQQKKDKNDKKDDQKKDDKKDDKKDKQDQKDKKDQQNKDQKDKQDKDKKDQKDQKKDQKDQDQKDKEKEKKDKEQQQKDKKDDKKKDNKEKPDPSLSDKLKDMKISEDKAKMILEAMKNQEVQYLQQNKRKATKPKDKGKPDW